LFLFTGQNRIEIKPGRWAKSGNSGLVKEIGQVWGCKGGSTIKGLVKFGRTERDQWLCEHNKALIGQLEARGNRFRAKGKANSNAERKAVVGKIGKA